MKEFVSIPLIVIPKYFLPNRNYYIEAKPYLMCWISDEVISEPN